MPYQHGTRYYRRGSHPVSSGWATDRQVGYIRDLVAKIPRTGDTEEVIAELEAHDIDIAAPGDGTRMTKAHASQRIEELIALRRRAPTPAPAPRVDQPKADFGVYKHADSEIYVVRPYERRYTRADSSTYVVDKRRCVKLVELTPGQATRVNADGDPIRIEFRRTDWMLYRLLPEERLSWVDAEPLIRKWGVCMMCGRTLKRGVVVELGVGWDCGQRFAGYNDRYKAVQAQLRERLRAAREAAS